MNYLPWIILASVLLPVAALSLFVLIQLSLKLINAATGASVATKGTGMVLKSGALCVAIWILAYVYIFHVSILFFPKKGTAEFDQGIACAQKQDWDGAIGFFDQTIKLDSQFSEAYYNRGIAYYNKNANKEAIADFTEAIRINPKSAQAFCNRGVVFASMGEHQKAIVDFNESLKLNPNEEVTRNNLRRSESQIR